MKFFLICIIGFVTSSLSTASVLAQDSFETSAIWSVQRHPAQLNASAKFTPTELKISGLVTDAEAKQAILKEANKLFLFDVLADTMGIDAKGVVAPQAIYGLSQLARLASGQVTISSGVLSISGQAQSDQNAQTVEAQIRQSLPTGLLLGEVLISPSVVTSYPWSVTWSEKALQFDGYVPSNDAKVALLADAKHRFPSANIRDNTVVANGAAPNFLTAAKAGLQQKNSLSAGVASLVGPQLSVYGSVSHQTTSAATVNFEDAFQAKAVDLPEGFYKGKFEASKPKPDTDQRSVEFLFATDRLRQYEDAALGFGASRSDVLTLGVARVHIPEDRRIGNIKLPTDYSFLGFTLYKSDADPKKHFILKDVELRSPDQWQALASSKGDEALIFVHGYNTSFADSAFRAAQIAWDLQYGGNLILFSWASKGETLGYEWDRNSAMIAREHFIELLKLLEANAGIRKIHVLAHSMGNLVVLDALSNYAQTADPFKIDQLVMAAPDIDSDEYKQSVRNVTRIVRGMTLYASSADKAMEISRTLAQARRAGDVVDGAPIVVDGVDAIDVTSMGDEILGVNHDTFAASRSLIDDIHLVLTGLRPPNKRLAQIRAIPEGTATPQFWRYAP